MFDPGRYGEYRYFLATQAARKKTISEHIGFFNRLLKNLYPCTPQSIKQYLTSLFIDEVCKGQTVNHYVSILRTWDRCFNEHNFDILKFFKEDDPEVEPFTREEFEKFIAVPLRRGEDSYSYRRFTMFWKLVGYNGFRLGEVGRLRKDQIDFTLNRFKLNSRDTKTGRKRHPPIFPNIRKELEDYVEWCPNDQLFLTRNGNPIEQQAWGNNFRHRIRMCGIEREGLFPNSVRHTFITRNVNEMGLFATQAIVGHRQVSTTEKYVQLDDSMVQEATYKDPWIQNLINPEEAVENYKKRTRELKRNKQVEVEEVLSPRKYVVTVTW